MTADPCETAYHGAINVTAERLEAWGRWKDNYVADCIENWLSQGSAPDDCERGAVVVAAELAAIDSLEWMPLGMALSWRADALLSKGPLSGDRKVAYLNSLRTAETSTEHERTLAVAYQLGISVQQAESLRRNAARSIDRDADGEARTALYRHFDESGLLLYVGIAKEPGKRAEQHRYHSKWHRFVADTTTEWFPTRAAAEQAERAAIADESPIFNSTHNRANRAAAIDYLFGALEPASDSASSEVTA